MKLRTGDVVRGRCGTATEVFIDDPVEMLASVLASWFIEAPGQSPGWDKYLLSVIHLRPIVVQGQSLEAVVYTEGATHEFVLAALDPAFDPAPTDGDTLRRLHPINLVEQVAIPDDVGAVELAEMAARAVVDGRLWAEPPLSGQVEPWHYTLQSSAAHLRGEHDAEVE